MDDDLKELVIQAGLEILEQQGLTLALNSVTYAKVFAYLAEEYSVSVTRGSVHERIWANQEAYRRDVLEEVVAYLPQFDLGATLFRNAAGRTGTEEVARGIGDDIYRQALDSHIFGQPASVKALASYPGDPADTELLGSLLNNRSTHILAEGRLQLPGLAVRAGLARRSEFGFTWDQTSDYLHSALGSLLEGGFLNYKAGSVDIFSSVDFRSTDADDGEPWRVASIGVKCLLDFLFESDPDLTSEHQVENVDVPIGPLNEPDAPIVDPSTDSARRPRRDLKRLVVAAGAELLLRDGMQLGPELLGYAEVFEYIRRTRGFTVHRSSVHGRVWESNEAFRLEVLARSLLSSSHAWPSGTHAMQSAAPVFNVDGSSNRLQTAYDVMRNLSDAYSIESAERADYERLLQVKATLLNRPGSRAADDLRAVIRKTDRARLDHNKILIQYHILDLGFRVRPETNLGSAEALELFSTLMMTIFSGSTLSAAAGVSAAQGVYLPRQGADAGDDRWTVLGTAARSFFDQIYELT